MPNLSADEVISHRHKRGFIQYGGAVPTAKVRYGGQDGQYMSITGVSNPEAGGVDPIRVHDPRRPGTYRLIGRSVSPADLPTATIALREQHNAIPRALLQVGCQLNAYEVSGRCKDLSDFISGWEDYVLVYGGGIITDKDLGDRVAFDSDDVIEDSLSLVFSRIYPVASLAFGLQGTSQVDREVVDIVYGSKFRCGACGPSDDGTSLIYALQKSAASGSTTLAAKVLYSTTGGTGTWSSKTIDGISADEQPVAIDIVGDKLVILSVDGTGLGALYWATINEITGVPGTFTKVTTGFDATKDPTDMYVASPREVFISAAGGYIYKSTDVTAGVTTLSAGSATSSNLQRIHGYDNVIVAVGASGTVIRSTNRGATFATLTNSPAATTLQAVRVLNENLIWVGGANGKIYYTDTAGEAAWTEKTFSNSGAAASQITDIVFVTPEVGFFLHNLDVAGSGATAKLWATWNGGVDWASAAPRVNGWPTFDGGNRIATPDVDDAGVAANNVAIGGLAADGSDGVVTIGAPNVI